VPRSLAPSVDESTGGQLICQPHLPFEPTHFNVAAEPSAQRVGGGPPQLASGQSPPVLVSDDDPQPVKGRATKIEAKAKAKRVREVIDRW